MAAVNGFTLVAPDERYGTSDSTIGASYEYAQEFVAPGSGTIEISSIGVNGYSPSAGSYVRLGIFTYDDVNDCPQDLVENSWTAAVEIPTSRAIISAEYSTKPQLTGGSTYCLALMVSGVFYMSRFLTGGTTVYKDTCSYGTWATPSEWETHTDSTRDLSLYAVYAAAGGASPVPKIIAAYMGGR